MTTISTKNSNINPINNKVRTCLTMFIAATILCSNVALANTKVAISQIIDHISLNANRKGIEDTLAKQKNIDVIYNSAQGSFALSTQIANKYIANNVDVIVAISTPSAQTALSARKTANIPIVFSAVTDPIAANLVTSLTNQQNNITGAIDTPPLEELLNIVDKVFRAKRVGIIYNKSESNSVKTVAKIKELLKNDREVIEAIANSSTTVGSAANKLIGKVDVIILPSDNTVFSAMDNLIKITNEAKIPVVSSDSDSVSKGVLLSVGYSQYDVGVVAGEQILKIINGEKADNIMITKPKNYELVINQNTANKIGIKIENHLLEKAKIIGK